MPLQLAHQDIGQGKVLVVLHGLFGSLDNWNTLAKQWAEEFRVVSVDIRNHGRSPHSDEMTYEAMAQDLLLLFNTLTIDKATILGHSMGGKLAMTFADTYPERVKSLMVADIAPRAYPPGHTTLFNAMRGIDLSAYKSRRAVDQALAEKIPVFGVRQFLLKGLGRDENKAFRWKFNLEALYTHYDTLIGTIRLKTPSYSGPTLFLKGDRSDYISPSDENKIMNYYPNAEVKAIAQAGHWLHADNPEAVYKAVLQTMEEA